MAEKKVINQAQIEAANRANAAAAQRQAALQGRRYKGKKQIKKKK